MSFQRQLFLAAYDIACDRRRAGALKRLRAHATGGQRSAHEVWLTDAERRALLVAMPLHLAAGDRFALLRLDPRSRTHVLGRGRPPADPHYFYVG